MFRLRLSTADARRFRDAVTKTLRDYPKRCHRAVVIIAESIMTESKDVYVPVDLGVLKNTGHVKPYTRVWGGTTRYGAELNYGGPAAQYAAKQHEEEGYKHEVGGAKYLERPLLAHVRTFVRDVVALERLRRR